MKRSLTLVLLLILGTGLASAGVEPSPFQPVVNQLNTVAKQLAKSDAKIFGIVDPIVDPVLGMPPDDIRPVLEDLDFLALAIYERALAGFAIPPDDQRVLEALTTVQINAQALQETIQFYLEEPVTDYTVRFYNSGSSLIQEVELSLYDFEGPCAVIDPPIGSQPWDFQVLLADESGNVPDYTFDVAEGTEVFFALATAIGIDETGLPWQATACGDAVQGIIDIWFEPPGS